MAGRVGEWFWRWVREHVSRHRLTIALPDPDAADSAAFYEGWWHEFERHGVNARMAHEASLKLVGKPPLYFKGQHFSTLLEYALEHATTSHGTRQASADASRECPACSGTGLSVAFPPDGRGGTAPAYCTCPLGRWIERNHRDQCPDVRRRFVDLADVDSGKSRWLRYPAAIA